MPSPTAHLVHEERVPNDFVALAEHLHCVHDVVVNDFDVEEKVHHIHRCEAGKKSGERAVVVHGAALSAEVQVLGRREQGFGVGGAPWDVVDRGRILGEVAGRQNAEQLLELCEAQRVVFQHSGSKERVGLLQARDQVLLQGALLRGRNAPQHRVLHHLLDRFLRGEVQEDVAHRGDGQHVQGHELCRKGSL